MSDKKLIDAVTIGALTYACTEALSLLENPDAKPGDADKVIRLLKIVLNPREIA